MNFESNFKEIKLNFLLLLFLFLFLKRKQNYHLLLFSIHMRRAHNTTKVTVRFITASFFIFMREKKTKMRDLGFSSHSLVVI